MGGRTRQASSQLQGVQWAVSCASPRDSSSGQASNATPLFPAGRVSTAPPSLLERAVRSLGLSFPTHGGSKQAHEPRDRPPPTSPGRGGVPVGGSGPGGWWSLRPSLPFLPGPPLSSGHARARLEGARRAPDVRIRPRARGGGRSARGAGPGNPPGSAPHAAAVTGEKEGGKEAARRRTSWRNEIFTENSEPGEPRVTNRNVGSGHNAAGTRLRAHTRDTRAHTHIYTHGQKLTQKKQKPRGEKKKKPKTRQNKRARGRDRESAEGRAWAQRGGAARGLILFPPPPPPSSYFLKNKEKRRREPTQQLHARSLARSLATTVCSRTEKHK